MLSKINVSIITILLSVSLIFAQESKKVEKDIVDIAVSTGTFKTLVTAVTEAGLVEALKGEGPFTVFAPTDDAFAKLPEGAVADLLKDKEALKKVLLYHVVSGKITSADVVGLNSANTLAEVELKIKTDDSGVMINNAKVITADVNASNGVIHVIDTVLLPPSDNSQEKSKKSY